MKKVIAAAAGLMLVGAMVSTASAAVSFSGDARARWYYEKYTDGTPETGENEKWSSRVRVKVKAEAAGGAYAHARIRITDATWDGAGVANADKGEKNNAYWDYAYLGIPMGPVVGEAGYMPTHITKFFLNDQRATMAVLKWQNEMTALQFWYIKELEFTDPLTDTIDDDDINGYAGIWNQKFSGDWGITVAGIYYDNQTNNILDGRDGFTGTIGFSGPAGPVSLQGELSYAEKDILVESNDDGLGGYLQGAMNFGATTVTVNGGFAQDAFKSDPDFGFIMLGGGSAITPAAVARFGDLGDTWWIGATVGFKVSEDLSIKGILAYMDVDERSYGDFNEFSTSFGGNAYEISGGVSYAISDGAAVDWVIGWLQLDIDDTPSSTYENPFGTAVTFEIKF